MENSIDVFVARATVTAAQNNKIPMLTSEIGPIRIAAEDLFRFRFGIFKEKLGWDVPTTQNQFEVDAYDGPQATYLMARSQNKMTGCMRLLPTTSPYMLKDTFPELLDSATAPADPDIWEVSRFACVEQSAQHNHGGISASSMALMQTAIRIAVEKKLKGYVIVTTTSFERLLKRLGLDTERYGSARNIGKEMTVAFFLPINQKTIDAFLSPTHPHLQYPTYKIKEAALEPMASHY
jgi:acyl homoserine lactone synthase